MVSCNRTIAYLSEDGEALRHPGWQQPPVAGQSHRAAHWYAVKTFPRHEKRIREHLEYRGIECFLPLYQSVRRWKNGCKVRLDMPLFPSYLFVEIDPRDRVRVLDVPGVHAMVGSGREPWPLPESEIASLRRGVELRKFEPHAYLTAGQRVRIKSGALASLTGILTRKNNGLRVVMALDLIQQGMAVEVDADDVEPVN